MKIFRTHKIPLLKTLPKKYLRCFIFIVLLFVFYTILGCFSKYNVLNKYLRRVDSNQVKYFPESEAALSEEKIFWDSRVSHSEEEGRTGLGEHGVPASLELDQAKKQALWDTNGFNALLSDSIAFDRTLKDIRNPKCKALKYNKALPTVSVVIPFFEEHFSTLLRTVVSVINRSPSSILKEIILVDDGSSMKRELGEPLDRWLRDNQPIARVVRLPERVGLILARQRGVEVATADVIVVLDSHCEVMIDWLPPLLEPIVENPRTAVCPLIDVINAENFAYYPQDEGGRGAFDWRFYYKRLPLREADIMNMPHPFENPVMNGGLFAMSRTFFWELGGYDPGLRIWGAEQYDLSFKIWQCGGRLLDAPCSRVGHVFRHGGSKRPAAKNAGNFIMNNYKRVAVVWMDEYADALYKRNPSLKTFDPGDVSSEIEVRNRLKCKSFKWFLENVAPDLLVHYPHIEPPPFAEGSVESVALTSKCVDTAGQETGDLILYACHRKGPQIFSLGYKKNIEIENQQYCWQCPFTEGSPPQLRHCEKDPSHSQIWRYDPNTRQIQAKAHDWCLDVDTTSESMQMKKCDSSKLSQQWLFQKVEKELIKDKYPFL